MATSAAIPRLLKLFFPPVLASKTTSETKSYHPPSQLGNTAQHSQAGDVDTKGWLSQYNTSDVLSNLPIGSAVTTDVARTEAHDRILFLSLHSGLPK